MIIVSKIRMEIKMIKRKIDCYNAKDYGIRKPTLLFHYLVSLQVKIRP